MSADLLADSDQLEAQVLAAIDGAPDEAALEAARVAALGKKGIDLRAARDARQARAGRAASTHGAAINALKDQVTEALERAPRAVLKRRGARGAARSARRSTSRCPSALRRRRDRPHPSDQPGDGRDHRHFRRYGLLGRRRARTSRATTTISPSSTSRPAIRRARCTTRSSSSLTTRASARFCARIRARCRCARC